MDTVKFKDVAHLYLMAKCIVRNFDTPMLLTGISYDDTQRQWWCYFEGSEIGYAKIEEVKPLLRKLDSMTEEENKESSKLYFDFMEKQKPSTRDITMMAHMTKWFISKHFDLFSLIENGEAIEALSTTTS